jgi:hypothetical protein
MLLGESRNQSAANSRSTPRPFGNGLEPGGDARTQAYDDPFLTAHTIRLHRSYGKLGNGTVNTIAVWPAELLWAIAPTFLVRLPGHRRVPTGEGLCGHPGARRLEQDEEPACTIKRDRHSPQPDRSHLSPAFWMQTAPNRARISAICFQSALVYQPQLPGPPLNGPTTSGVIQPP